MTIRTLLPAGLLLLPVFAAVCTARQPAPGPPVELRTEYERNPLGVDRERPRFFWQVNDPRRDARQTAWQLLVAGSRERLARGEGDVWDSGRVEGSRQLQVRYGGPPLEPGRRYYWKVRTWDAEGVASAYSEPAWWETGLMNPGEWTGSWIGSGRPAPEHPEEFYGKRPVPLFRKAFRVAGEVVRARLYISGLGYCEARLNGEKVGDRVLDPGWTNYGKTVYYSTYDVTGQLAEGDNVLGVMLGNGWYNPLPLRMWGRINIREFLTVGRPKFIARLDLAYRDGSVQTIRSDTTWRAGEGHILKNNVYLGEYHDARLRQEGWDRPGFADGAWSPAVVAEPPGGELVAQVPPPIRITQELEPAAVTEPEPGVYVVDMGENFAGGLRLRAEGPEGTEITMRYGELLHPDGTVNGLTAVVGQIKEVLGTDGGPGAPGTGWQEDTFILAGDGVEVFEPRFTFHGYRYVEIRGYPGRPGAGDVTGLRVHTDLEPAGAFSCSNPMFNELQEVTRRTFLSNVHSVQSDCPHREKFGYGGDIVTAGEAYLYNYHMGGFYTKTVRDFARDVRPNGGLPETAPYNGIEAGSYGEGAGPIGWQYAHPFLQANLYRFYGDTALIREQYPVTRGVVEHFRRNAENHIIDRGIGDHATVDEKPNALTGTAFYYDLARLLGSFAGILGREEDAREYGRLADEIRARFIEEFLEPGTGRFDIGNQAAQAFALYYDLVPDEERERALQRLVGQIMEEHDGHVSAGIFGTKMTLDVLRRYGRNEVAYAMADRREFPGWGHMLANGATTLWEEWHGGDNIYSHNHPMYGSVSEWFYEALAGITPHPEAAGFDRIVIRPLVAGGLTSAGGSYRSIRGVVESRWRLEEGVFTLEVTLPANTAGEIHLPGGGRPGVRVSESGTLIADGDAFPAARPAGIHELHLRDNAVVARVGAGTYRFTVRPQPK